MQHLWVSCREGMGCGDGIRITGKYTSHTLLLVYQSARSLESDSWADMKLQNFWRILKELNVQAT